MYIYHKFTAYSRFCPRWTSVDMPRDFNPIFGADLPKTRFRSLRPPFSEVVKSLSRLRVQILSLYGAPCPQFGWSTQILKSQISKPESKTPASSPDRRQNYVVSTDRDVPLIWVCFFSDLVWVGMGRYFLFKVPAWVVILYRVKNACFIGNPGDIQT